MRFTYVRTLIAVGVSGHFFEPPNIRMSFSFSCAGVLRPLFENFHQVPSHGRAFSDAARKQSRDREVFLFEGVAGVAREFFRSPDQRLADCEKLERSLGEYAEGCDFDFRR